MTEPAAPHGTTSTLPPQPTTPPPAAPPSPASAAARLVGRTLHDGGWWPRSADLAAEMPGVILAVGERHGPITRVMLGHAGWDASRSRRLRIDGRRAAAPYGSAGSRPCPPRC